MARPRLVSYLTRLTEALGSSDVQSPVRLLALVIIAHALDDVVGGRRDAPPERVSLDPLWAELAEVDPARLAALGIVLESWPPAAALAA